MNTIEHKGYTIKVSYSEFTGREFAHIVVNGKKYKYGSASDACYAIDQGHAPSLDPSPTLSVQGEQASQCKLRRFLYDNPQLFAVIGEHEYTNGEARWVLYDMPIGEVLNYAIEGDCLHIWGI